MKIKQSVRELYQELCPYSAHKCDTYEEMDYKIIRAVELGKVINTYPYRVLQYHNLRFTVDGDTVVDINKNNEYFDVYEERKVKHARRYYNIVV